MDPTDLIALARRWLSCFESRDVEALVALYAEDARHTPPKIRALHPETGGFLVGKAKLRAWWSESFARLPGLRYLPQSFTCDGTRVFMEYTRICPGEADLPVSEVLEAREGKIVASRVYHG